MKNVIATLNLLACSTLLLGCAVDSETEPQPIYVLERLTFESGHRAGPIQFSTQNGELLMEGSGWNLVVPGIWQNGAQRLVVGHEGHRSALALEELNLAKLRERGADNTVLRASEEELVRLSDAVSIIKDQDLSTLVTCTVGFVQGPSSLLTGRPGVVAMTEVSCAGGFASFTVQARACVDGRCSPTYSLTNTGVGSYWGAGTSWDAAAGLPCSAMNAASPTGGSSTWIGTCG